MSPLARFARLSTPVRAAGFVLLAGVGFALMIMLIRHLATNLLVDPMEIVFFRNLFASIGMLPWLMRHGAGAMKTRRFPLVSLRVLFGLISMATWFSALAIVPIANAVALSFTAPLFAAVAAVLVLGEKVRARRITALLLGFGGMLVILRPGHAEVGWGELLVVLSAMTMAFSIICMKLLTRTEQPAALVAWQNMLLTPVSLVPALFFWTWPTPEAWLCLAAVGFIATLSHLCFTRGFSMADTTYLLPFDYIRLPLVAVLGWFAFGEATDIWTWVGAAIIAASTFYVARREALARRKEIALEGKGPVRTTAGRDPGAP